MRSLLLLSVAVAFVGRQAVSETKREQRAAAETVVFVCEHGSVKSLMAQEWFNRLARGRGLGLRAVSRGMVPDTAVPRPVVDHLASEGFDVSGFQPRSLTKSDLTGARRVVALGANTSSVTASAAVPVESWDDIPPSAGRYDRTSDAIRTRVEGLLDALQRQ